MSATIEDGNGGEASQKRLSHDVVVRHAAGDAIKACMLFPDGTLRDEITVPDDGAYDFVMAGARLGARLVSDGPGYLPEGTPDAVREGHAQATKVIEDYTQAAEGVEDAEAAELLSRTGSLGSFALAVAAEGINRIAFKNGLLDSLAFISAIGGTFGAAKWWKYYDVTKARRRTAQVALATARRVAGLADPEDLSAPSQPTNELPVISSD